MPLEPSVGKNGKEACNLQYQFPISLSTDSCCSNALSRWRTASKSFSMTFFGKEKITRISFIWLIGNRLEKSKAFELDEQGPFREVDIEIGVEQESLWHQVISTKYEVQRNDSDTQGSIPDTTPFEHLERFTLVQRSLFRPYFLSS